MQKNTVRVPDDPVICLRCGGTGWKELVSENERRVTRCDCFLQSQAGRLLDFSGIPSRYANCEFSSYSTENSNALGAAKITVENWAKQYPLDRTGLLLVGPSGVGKTHLSVAALRYLMKKGVHGLFCDYRELLKRIQNSYNPSVQATELEVLRPVFESEVLLLDDLGAVKPSEWVWDTVSLILNNRYNDNRTTIITTNFLDGPARNSAIGGAQAAGREETLGDRIGERMRSRLFEMCRLVQVHGRDFRQNFRSGGTK
jgi:DNA replication protein DnaC